MTFEYDVTAIRGLVHLAQSDACPVAYRRWDTLDPTEAERIGGLLIAAAKVARAQKPLTCPKCHSIRSTMPDYGVIDFEAGDGKVIADNDTPFACLACSHRWRGSW